MGCSPSGIRTDLPDELAVCETVLRHEWAKRSLEANDGIDGFYLATQDADFPDAFYQRFKGNTPPVRKISELPLPINDLRHALWTSYWVWFFDPPKRVEQDMFRVHGGYQCGESCIGTCDYTVVRKNGRWFVDRADQCRRP